MISRQGYRGLTSAIVTSLLASFVFLITSQSVFVYGYRTQTVYVGAQLQSYRQTSLRGTWFQRAMWNVRYWIQTPECGRSSFRDSVEPL